MEVIILAGGFGTRLQNMVSDRPKPMALICGKPFLHFLFCYLKKYNVIHIVLSVGYKSDMIVDYFADAYNGINITYSFEDKPLGTGGAIKQALKFTRDQDVIVINGDTLFNISLTDLTLPSGADISIALKEMSCFDRYGSILTNEDGQIVSFKEKEYQSAGLINAGIYRLTRNLFDNIETEDRFSFESFMGNNVNKINIFSNTFDDYFVDIGVPDDYIKAQKEVVTLFQPI